MKKTITLLALLAVGAPMSAMDSTKITLEQLLCQQGDQNIDKDLQLKLLIENNEDLIRVVDDINQVVSSLDSQNEVSVERVNKVDFERLDGNTIRLVQLMKKMCELIKIRISENENKQELIIAILDVEEKKLSLKEFLAIPDKISGSIQSFEKLDTSDLNKILYEANKDLETLKAINLINAREKNQANIRRVTDI